MRTYEFTGTVTALTSIAHNGGERNGTITQLRREKFVQPNGKIAQVPIISGNSVRGILRDAGMYNMLQSIGYGIQEDGKVAGLPLPAFYFLFSGGSLTSTGAESVNIGDMRRMKKAIPLLAIFGGAIGNSIMPGKMKMGKMIPICKETNHLLPEKYRNEDAHTSWEYCQTEMYTRRDDKKNDRLLPMLEGNLLEGGDLFPEGKKPKKETAPQQMLYEVETLAAGTQFFWRIILEDVSDLEFESFIAAMLTFSRAPFVGGKSAVGHGEISVNMDKWIEIDSRTNLKGKEVDTPLMEKYHKHLKENKTEIKEWLEKIK